MLWVSGSRMLLLAGILASSLTGIMPGLSCRDAHAGSKLKPGITTGLALGAANPEGLTSISFPIYGVRETSPRTNTTTLIPSWLIWSTPYTIAGGRILVDIVVPYVDEQQKHHSGSSSFGNPFLDTQVKWDLGHGFHGGFQAGIYLPVHAAMATNDLSFQGIAALSYLQNGWNLTSTLAIGTGSKGEEGNPGWFNVDLTATRTFNKFEIGAVAFGSTDLSSPYETYGKQSQFAVGALVGYGFETFTLQLKLTRDVYQRNYGGYETSIWANIIVPLWRPEP